MARSIHTRQEFRCADRSTRLKPFARFYGQTRIVEKMLDGGLHISNLGRHYAISSPGKLPHMSRYSGASSSETLMSYSSYRPHRAPLVGFGACGSECVARAFSNSARSNASFCPSGGSARTSERRASSIVAAVPHYDSITPLRESDSAGLEGRRA